MATSHVELYEALEGKLGEAGARMIAEVVPPAADLATKRDVGEVKVDLAEVKVDLAEVKVDLAEVEARLTREIARVRGEIAGVREEVQASTSSTLRWMLAFFIPVWAGTWGTVIAVLLRGV